MKKLIFMRHGYLEGKYKDYSKLNFNEFEKLLTRKVDPKLDKEKTKSALKAKECLANVDFVVCSSESRAVETARLVKEIIDVDFRFSSLLNEVSFSKGIIDRGDVADFNNLRIKILTQFYNSNHSEKLEDAKKRLLCFLKHAKTLNYDVLLCITHGWFMRLIYIYSAENSLENISLKRLLDAKVQDFLGTIEVELN